MAEDAAFHFAWVDPEDTTFSAGTHAVEDEDVLRFRIQQNEGEFATAEVEMRRPTEGLLNPARKQYAWISVTRSSTTTPLFFGRVVGLPRDLEDAVAVLEFVAQFPGWEDELQSLFETLKEAPFWDLAFIPSQDLNDPYQALEARSALYHFHRTTGAITLSDDIVGGSSATVSNHFHDSLKMDVTDNPARRVTVTATVEWLQHITGISQNVATRISRAFPGNAVNTFSGEQLAATWPSAGDSVGGQSGYEVVYSRIQAYADTQLPSTYPGKSSTFKTKISEGEQGFANALLGAAQETRDATVRRYWFDIALDVGYVFRQQREETITFSVENDVQALAFDADGGEIKINLNAEDVVGRGLQRPLYSTYFLTSNGQASFKYLLARARASLTRAARAVEVGFEMPFFDAMSLSCDYHVTLTDARLPGGAATGKVKAYTLSVDGDTGQAIAAVTLGVSVGNGNTYTASGTAGEYCTTAYVESSYQTVTGEDADPATPDMIFQPYTGQIPDDPPIINRLINDDIIQAINITNSPAEQDALLLANQAPELDDPSVVVDQNPTQIELQFRSLEPFDLITHTIEVTIPDPWAAPQGIDLAA